MLWVDSEIGKLRKVVVHRPGQGMEYLTPNKLNELLFDDIVYLERMQTEHDRFVRILSMFVDEVLDAEDLLAQLLEDEIVRHEIVASVSNMEFCSFAVKRRLLDTPPAELAQILISGRLDKHLIFPPIPNLVFTRDLAAIIGSHVITSKPAKQARLREALISKYIFHDHATLGHAGQLIEITNDEGFMLQSRKEQERGLVSIEGGDLMYLHRDHLLVGCSERTSKSAFQKIRDLVLEHDIVKNIYSIELPQERGKMHLDTVMTQASAEEFVAYEPLFFGPGRNKTKIYRYSANTPDGEPIENLLDLVSSVFPGVKFISCGNGEYPHDVREQWTDGCNLVALRPGLVIGYGRNKRTRFAMQQAGYFDVDSLTPEEEIARIAANEEKVLITLQSSELSRGRGGPHCMTLPLKRDSYPFGS